MAWDDLTEREKAELRADFLGYIVIPGIVIAVAAGLAFAAWHLFLAPDAWLC